MTNKIDLDKLIGDLTKILAEKKTMDFECRALLEHLIEECIHMVSERLILAETEEQAVIDADGNRTISVDAISNAVYRRLQEEYPRAFAALDLPGMMEKKS
jgi:hypothetical protein